MREQEGHRTDVFIGTRAFSLVKWEGAVPGPPASGFPTTAGHHSRTSPIPAGGPLDPLRLDTKSKIEHVQGAHLLLKHEGPKNYGGPRFADDRQGCQPH